MTTPDDDPRSFLGPLDVPPPPADLTRRVLTAAAPLLAARARRATWRAWLRPLAVALVPLPLIVAADIALVRALYTVLALVLPSALSTYLVAQYALLITFLVATGYAAVPLLADRQSRAVLEDAHV